MFGGRCRAARRRRPRERRSAAPAADSAAAGPGPEPAVIQGTRQFRRDDAKLDLESPEVQALARLWPAERRRQDTDTESVSFLNDFSFSSHVSLDTFLARCNLAKQDE